METVFEKLILRILFFLIGDVSSKYFFKEQICFVSVILKFLSQYGHNQGLSNKLKRLTQLIILGQIDIIKRTDFAILTN